MKNRSLQKIYSDDKISSLKNQFQSIKARFSKKDL